MTDGAVSIRQTAAGIVGFSGLTTCGRVWLCPVCNSKVMARRAIEIGAALTWAAVEGFHIIWGALTVRHNVHSKLGRLIEIQQDAWRSVMNSKPWQKSNQTRRVDHVHGVCKPRCAVEVDVRSIKGTPTRVLHVHASCETECDRSYDTVLLEEGEGRVGYIRAAELTIGKHGWHPHFHPIIVFRGTKEAAQLLADVIVKTWVAGVVTAGGDAIEEGAQQLRVLSGVEVYDELARYVTKATYDPSKLALETVWSQSKIGRGRVKETVSHWNILAGIEQGLSDDVDLWWELEEATHGHRMITWSRGLRGFAGLSVEKEDEEIAGEEVGTVEDTVAVITPAGWKHVRDTPEALAGILDALEASGVAGMAAVLDLYGVEWCQLEDLAPAN
jgi:hypothetical protein